MVTSMDTSKAPLLESRRRAILDWIIEHGDVVERHYLEAKSDIDLTSKLGCAKVAKFILGAANRLPGVAQRHFEGYAVLVIGAEKGRAVGIAPGLERLDLSQKLERYLSPNGPSWDVDRLRLADGREVLFVIVEPPKYGEYEFWRHRAFQADGRDTKHNLLDGGIYVRGDGDTRLATSNDLAALHMRGAGAEPSLELSVTLEGAARHYLEVDDACELYTQVVCSEARLRAKEFAVTYARPEARAVAEMFNQGKKVTVPTAEEVETSIAATASRFVQCGRSESTQSRAGSGLG
jgi:hypothetical protein